MRKYEKIPTIFERSMDGSKALMPGWWCSPTVAMLHDIPWDWTEKIDGTGIRVHWDGHKVEYGGRTESASIPAHLINRLNELFGGETNAQVFEQMFGEKEVYIYGEGFCKKIQKGHEYLPDSVDFAIFDIMICGNYQPRSNVESIAQALGARVVPVVGHGTLSEAIAYVKTNPDSTIGKAKMEGLVCRPFNELQDRCGNRIIVKIKYKDFKNLKYGEES